MRKTIRRHVPAALLAIATSAASAPRAIAEVRPGLEGARQLFQHNRWAQARAHVRSSLSSLSTKDQAAARFLIGRSFVREAEFYGAVRSLADEIGRAYLTELGSDKANRDNPYIALFEGLYALDAGDARQASDLLATASRAQLPQQWRALALQRRNVALRRLGDAQGARALAADATIEGSFWRMLLTGELPANVSPPSTKAGRRERLLATALLFRTGRSAEAEKAAAGIDLDAPDVEHSPVPKKTLRFFDPITLVAWERLLYERAVVVLRPLAASGGGAETALATHDMGVSLFHLGAWGDAQTLLERSSAQAPSAELRAVARLLAAASRWPAAAPKQAELDALASATTERIETVLIWEELRRPELASREPFASALDKRLALLLSTSDNRPDGATVGRWGLARLRRDAEAGNLLTELSSHRDHSNKNKLEWNDPLLLLALTGANYRNNEYAQALETLFEMAKTLPGLRELQWNLQGIYAARQKSGGEARISQ